MTDHYTKLMNQTLQQALSYLHSLRTRAVIPNKADIDRLGEFDQLMPDRGTDALEVVSILNRLGSPGTVATAGPRFFGFVNGGTLPAALAANWLAGAWDQDAGMSTTSPVSAKIEAVVTNWLIELLGLPAGCGSAFVTGATMANFSALAAARRHVLDCAGWDVESDGLFGAPPVTVVVGETAHVSLFKALGLLGLGRKRILTASVDSQGRIIASKIPRIAGPMIVCTQAGQVNTGVFDPIAEICDELANTGTWVHVDGAFGLWARASQKLAHLAIGVEKADSWVIDAHKWLNVPYDSGIALVRHPGALRSAMSISADYLPSTNVREPDQYTPELSRRARGVEIWAVLKSLGRDGLADLLNGCCDHATQFATRLSEAGFELLNQVELNQVLVSLSDDLSTARLVQAIQTGGICYCSQTMWRGRVAMRISVSCWATTADDVDRSIESIIQAASEVRLGSP